MANSMVRLPDDGSIEDYITTTSFSHTPHREYRVERTTDAVLHYEIGRDAEGVIYDQAVPVKYAMGSGKRGRSYVIDREGLLFMSPISWYTQGQRWDLSPMYATAGHLRFERRVASRCVVCHVGRAAPVPSDRDRFLEPPFVELSIGCERCHGPGEQHVARHREAREVSAPDPIINPLRLDPERRDSVCNQCHLQGADEVLRYGRTDFDFRPGMHLAEVWTVFLGSQDTQSTKSTVAVSQVEQMLSSRCAQASGGRLGCISCHDPHSIPAESERPAFYRERCLRCHGDDDCRESIEKRRDTESDSCIQCHMPRLAASDVPHTTQTDHRIRKHSASDNVTPPTPSTNSQRWFGQGEVALSPIEDRRARGLLLAHQAEHNSNPTVAASAVELLRGVLLINPDDVTVLDALAISEFVTGDRANAERHWRGVLTRDSRNETAMQSLAMLTRQTGNLTEAGERLAQLIQINPWSANYQAQYAQVCETQGRTEAAVKAALRGVELDPSRSFAHDWLASALARKGDRQRSQHHRRTAQRLRAIESQPPPGAPLRR
ncbi:MAG: hypothetical protein HZA46_07480 [Planctomycetales bacterium]|nr:hypothetical protein [Planctomycetales bacterium]